MIVTFEYCLRDVLAASVRAREVLNSAGVEADAALRATIARQLEAIQIVGMLNTETGEVTLTGAETLR